MRGYTFTDLRHDRREDEVNEWPPDITVGVAYPCLEDLLNVFSVVRATIITKEDLSADEESDPAIMQELDFAVDAALEKGSEKLREIASRLESLRIVLLGTNMDQFALLLRRFMQDGIPACEAERFSGRNCIYVDQGDNTRCDPTRSVLSCRRETDFPEGLNSRQFIAHSLRDLAVCMREEENLSSLEIYEQRVLTRYVMILVAQYHTTNPLFYASEDQFEDAFYRGISAELEAHQEWAQTERRNPSWKNDGGVTGEYCPITPGPAGAVIPDSRIREAAISPCLAGIAGALHSLKSSYNDFVLDAMTQLKHIDRQLRAFGVISMVAEGADGEDGCEMPDHLENLRIPETTEKPLLFTMNLLAHSFYSMEQDPYPAMRAELKMMWSHLRNYYHALQRFDYISEHPEDLPQYVCYLLEFHPGHEAGHSRPA